MKKLAKTVLTLGAVYALTACGGIKWKTVSMEEFLAATSESVLEEVVDLKLSEIKERITVTTEDYEFADTKFEDSFKSTCVIDLDAKNLNAHINKETSTKNDDFEDDEYDVNAEDSLSLSFGLDDNHGFIVVNEDTKEYSVIYTNEYLEENGTPDYSVEEICRDTLITFISLVAGSSAFYGEMNMFLSDDYFTDDCYYPGSTYDVKYEIADGGCYRGTSKVTGSYDDADVYGYKVDFVEKASSELRDYTLFASSYEYKETGKYYVTDTELVDYSYLVKRDVKTSSYKSFKLPALDTYTEVASAD